MPRDTVAPSLGRPLPHDWTRRRFTHLPGSPGWREHVEAAYVHRGTTLEYLARSREGLLGAVVAYRRPQARPGDRRMVLWHGAQRLVEETFHGWFGPRVQRVRAQSFRLLLDRLPHFAVANAASEPTFVLPLPAFAALGASHGALEAVLGARVVVASEELYAEAAHLPSLRVYVDYDGLRYGDGARKLFLNGRGAPVVVESAARDVLQGLGYEVVYPSVFRRLFHILIGRPAAHFVPDTWPSAFQPAKLGPLEWADRGLRRIAEARTGGAKAMLLEALEDAARRPPYRAHPPPTDGLPLIGRYLTRARFESLIDALGDKRTLALMEGLLFGYEACAADWFAWEAGGSRAFFCEIKSTGDHLRETQKSTILWCQRAGTGIDYRLLEVLHGRAGPTHPKRARHDVGTAATRPAASQPG